MQQIKGEDGAKVYIVIKGEATQLKPKKQEVLEKEIHENITKIKVISLFKNNEKQHQNNDFSKLKKQFRRSNTQEFIVGQHNFNQDIQSKNLDEYNNLNENNQKRAFNKIQSVFQNDKFQQLKKPFHNFADIPGFNHQQVNKLTPEQRNLYFDEETNTFKFEIDTTINAGELFGQSAVSQDLCQMKTIVIQSNQDLSVLEISKSDYLKIFNQTNNKYDDHQTQTALKKPSLKQLKFQLFTSLFESSISKIKKFMSFFNHHTYPANHILWKKHQTTDQMYIILNGRVEISDNSETGQESQLEIPMSPKKQKKKIVVNINK